MDADALQFLGDDPDHQRPAADGRAAEGLHGPGVSAAVADDAVAGDGFGQTEEEARTVAVPQEELFHAAVLEAELDLQVVDVLALAGEPEVARLDDPGVDGADADFVDLLAVHAEEGVGRLARRRAGDAAPDRLEPGMAVRLDAELLVDLPFEEVERGTSGVSDGYSFAPAARRVDAAKSRDWSSSASTA